MAIQNAQEARKNKELSKLWSFDGKIMSMPEFFASVELTRKSIVIRHHETKRRELEYKALTSPKTEYTIWYKQGEEERGIGVSKTIFDHYDLPTSTREGF